MSPLGRASLNSKIALQTSPIQQLHHHCPSDKGLLSVPQGTTDAVSTYLIICRNRGKMNYLTLECFDDENELALKAFKLRWCDGKESACQCRKVKSHEFNFWVGKILKEIATCSSTLPGKLHSQRGLDMSEHTPAHKSCHHCFSLLH